ncbi:MAG: type II toxin-antitoxin system RelE family toxin [Roseimicrobium sp.]
MTPAGSAMLKSVKNRWRIRVGDCRIVYTIEDDRLLVLAISIAHRGDIYR